MKTYIYIDGFNFYYGAVKNTPYKWLDFKTLFYNLLQPQHNIACIKYFTAYVLNLAIHLLNDSWKNEFDCVVVVSNDSDLAEALRMVVQQNNKIVGVINPRIGKPPARELMKYAKFYKTISKGVLKISQLPDYIPGTKIHKPLTW